MVGFCQIQSLSTILIIEILKMIAQIKSNEDLVYEAQMKFIQRSYDEAYYRWLYCPESEQKEAKRMLDIWANRINAKNNKKQVPEYYTFARIQ